MNFRSTPRRGLRSGVGAFVALGLTVTVAAGCGSSDDGDSTTSDETIASVDARFDALPASGQQLVGAVVTRDQAQHVEMGMGIEMKVGAMSIDTAASAERPLVVTDVDDDGDTHTVMDMGAMFESMRSMAGGSAPDMPEMRAEQWSDGEWLYMDYTGFDALSGVSTDTNPFAGLMAPGLFKVNLDRAAEASGGPFSSSVLARSTGQNLDVTPYLYSLGMSADRAEPDPEDPSKQRVETTLDELLKQSTDGSVPMLDSLTGDQAEQMDKMIGVLGKVPVVYIYSTDDEGRIDELNIQMDMSSFFSEMAATEGDAGASMLQDATMKISIPMTIGYDAPEDITMPTGVEDDRTDQFIAAMDNLNATLSEGEADTEATTATTVAA